MAQLVNVIPAISTVKQGISWPQSIYYPLYFASLYGRGLFTTQSRLPKYSSEIADDVKYIDASAVLNKEKSEVSFIVNRSENDNCNIDLI